MVEFSNRIADEPEKLEEEASRNIDRVLASGERIAKAGVLDGFTLCCDYCLNTGPFLSPRLFRRLVTPYLKRMIAGYREQGFYTIKHTDGNIMPILDQLVECNPHALHSIDPQARVDIREVKRLVGDKVCLIGNVDCGLMDTGTDEQVVASARYALEHGMPGGGYIFSTSNCVYTGMELARYELIQRVWRQYGVYPG
jgi:uroporphyrinogen decarboxylase